MRRKWAVAAIVIMAAVAAAGANGLAFSVRPGLIINAAQVGYKGDNYFIGGGLEFASASWTDNYQSTEYDTMVYPETSYVYKYGSSLKASVFLPQVAAKYFWGGTEGDERGGGFARPFVGATVFYSIATASVTNTDSDSTWKDTVTSNELQGVLGGNLGGTLSFGGEYYFTRSLSLTGEFGVRYLFGGTSEKYRNDLYNGYENVNASDKLGLGFTYTTLGLNFYF